MKQFYLGLLGSIAVLALATAPARAGIPIPCTGEKIITVQKLPANVTVPIADGARIHLDLGYKFDGCSGGEWVGYAGSGREYYRLSPAQLKALLGAAGLRDLPPEPGFWSAPSVYGPVLLWLGFGGFTLIGGIRKSRGAAEPSPAQPATEADAVPHAEPAPARRTVSDWVERAVVQTDSLAKATPVERRDRGATTSLGVQARPQRFTAATASRTGFGRRTR